MNARMTSTGIHLAAYSISIALLALLAVLTTTMEHRGTPGIHTLMESVAAILALVIGGIALVRFYSWRDLPYLFIGAGFLGAGVFDIFHAWSSSVYAYFRFPSGLEIIDFWGWIMSRIYLGAMLVLSGWAWWWAEEERKHPIVSSAQVYLVSAFLVLTSFTLMLVIPLPHPEVAMGAIPRPQEFVPAILFLAALIGFFVMGRWRKEPAEHWLVLSLIVGVGLHALFMPFSTSLWDKWHDMAHVLKIGGYGLALGGLLINIHTLQRTLVVEERRLAEANLRLHHEASRRTAAEMLAADESELLQSVFESMADGVIVVDRDLRMARFNRMAETLTGKLSTDLPHEEWPRYYGIHLPDEKTFVPAEELPSARAVRGERFNDMSLYLENDTRPDGVHLSVSGAPVNRADGSNYGGVIILHDVTTQREIQEQLRHYTRELERRNQDLEDFATIVSHDLKEPLRKVLAFGERLEMRLGEDLPAEAHDHLRRMRQSAEWMRTLIEDLLAYTRLNERQILTDVDLTEVAERAVQDLEERIEETGGKVRVGTIGTLECDPIQMYQVFINLIGNALKYHRAEVPPDVQVYGQQDDKECRIIVEDEGIGFDMKYAERIFRPFHRLHSRTQFEGSGIGLAIVRKIVETHNGTIDVESRPDHGTRFILHLPLTTHREEVPIRVR